MRTAAAAPGAQPGQTLSADAGMAAAILLLGLFLAATGGSMVQRWRSSAARQQAFGFEDHLGIAANTAGLIVTVWWAMSLAIAVAAALLERGGRPRAASAAGKFAPVFMRRLALAAVGLQLLSAPLAAASPGQPPPAAASPAPAPSAGWTPPALPEGPHGIHAGAPAAVHPQWRPLSPVAEPGPLAARPRRAQPPAARGTEVTVRAGDSLWSVSAARLGPLASDVDIAADWPRIYQANRDTIGANPHLLRPGQVLRLPPGP